MALLTVVSKVVGLVRDMIVASAYGTTFLADAYNYAYLFTGNILILFGGLGGPFHSVTVTTLMPRKDKPEAGLLLTQIVLATAFYLSIPTLLVLIGAPLLIELVAPNYGGTSSLHGQFFEEAIRQLRLMSPLIVLSGLIGISYGVLNVSNKVFWPSLSPAVASVAIIIALILFPGHESSVPLAVGTLIGAFGQLFAQIPGIISSHYRFAFSLKAQEGLKNFSQMLFPALLATSVGQLIIYVDGFFCSGMVGGWTAINNANRLIQLPLGVLSTAMLVPMLPKFTEHATANRTDDLKDDYRKAVRILCFLAMPLAVILLVIPQPIVALLFQRGAFNEKSTALVTSALVFLVPSMLIYLVRDLTARVFLGMQDSKTPSYVALLALAVKACLDWLFIVKIPLGVAGISLATSLITLLNFGLLTVLLRKKIGRLGATKLILPLGIMLGAGIVSGIAIEGADRLIAPYLIGRGVVFQLIRIACDTAGGGVVYLAICSLLHLDEPKMIIQRFLKLGTKRSSDRPGG